MSLYTMIGAMSGTSMDGLDLVLCTIESNTNEHYDFKILNTKTFEYPYELLKQLRISKTLDAPSLFELDKRVGNFFALCINSFVQEIQIEPNEITAIASHGHTVHHRPEKGYTVQIGCGATIAKETGIQVICDFRQKDVVFGGQGAPLVPIGDKLLFRKKADGFLNVGGFTNICIPGDPTVAFDISPGNLPLNEIAQSFGKSYDDNGAIAAQGSVEKEVLKALNALPYYHQKAPKSLGTEWLENTFFPVINTVTEPIDRMHTCVIHIADQIFKSSEAHGVRSLYVTGGGACNGFLMEQLILRGLNIILPSPEEIHFKEALIFAFLGVRRIEGLHNCLASVTGASKDVCGGVIHLP